jgi:hypothetical protein
VHYEGIKSPSAKRLANASTVEQLLVASIGVAAAEPTPGVTELGLEDSGQALIIPYTSRNVDLDQLDAVRAGVGNSLVKRLTLRRAIKPEPIMLVLKHFRISATIARMANAISPIQFSYHRFVEDRRNVALAAARNALDGGDLVMTWGAMHIPVFVRSFCTAGYRVTNTGWVEVLDITQIRNHADGTGSAIPVESRIFDVA